jgi:uncharacterized membrane protein
VAALGLVGAFAVPLLVQSDAPSAFPLFAYLALVSAGSLAVLQYRAWPWLAWIWLGGAVFWVLLWLAAAERPETPVVGGFLLIQFGLFAALRHGIPRVGFLSGAGDTTLTRIITESAFWALAVAMFALVHADNFSAVSLICTVAAMLIALAFAYRDMALDRVIGVAGALPLALLASWNLPSVAPPIERVLRVGPPDQVEHFAAFALVSAALLGGLFLLLPRVARLGRWAALSPPRRR